MNNRYFWKWNSELSHARENLLYVDPEFSEMGLWCFLDHFRQLGAIQDPAAAAASASPAVQARNNAVSDTDSD